jgi:rhodanese-related sulfurtransferase
VVFVDARPRADFATARITGAFSVPGDVSADPAVMQAVLAADTVIVYCDRPQCGLSMRAARRLRELGARGVRVLGKGWPAWFAAGFPAQSGGGS